MYRENPSRIIELKRRAGLGKVPTSTIVFVLMLAIGLSGYGLFTWVFPHDAESSVVDVYGQGNHSSTEATAVASKEGMPEVKEKSTSHIEVHVVGAVKQPGVYRLVAGSRIADAIESAGGVTSDAEIRAVNFALILTDEMQIIVPTVEEAKQGLAFGVGGQGSPSAGAQVPAATAGQPTGATSSVVNINTATSEQLQTLPGIGPALAQRIISDREKNGAFSSSKDLARVSGIGAKKLEALEGLVATK